MIVKDYLWKWIQRDPLRYQGLHSDMISARVGMTLEQYLWRSMKFSLLIGVLFVILGYLSSVLLNLPTMTRKMGITNVFNIQLPVFNISIYPAEYIQGALVIISFFAGAYIGHSLLLRMPGIEKNNRKIKINLTLHNAVAYMYAMRRGGCQLMAMFRSLSQRSDIYGEVALEFRQIVRDADFFGYDVVSAIRHLSETTPSEKLKVFLEDLLSVIESGGDMAEFLSMRVRQYQEEAKFEQKQFLTFLAIVAESYVTIFVAGPLFLIIIMVVMGMMGGTAVLQLSLVTYAIIPIGSFIFILLVDLMSTKAEKTERYVKIKWLHTFSEVQKIKKANEEPLFEQLKKYDTVRNLIHQLRHPLESFVTNVDRTLYVTIPLAVIYVVVTLVNIPHYQNIENFITVLDDHIVIALLFIIIPYEAVA